MSKTVEELREVWLQEHREAKKEAEALSDLSGNWEPLSWKDKARICPFVIAGLAIWVFGITQVVRWICG